MAHIPVDITHPDRVVFPDCGLTKGDVATYYAAIAPVMLPFLAGRPVSLLRCPQGIGAPCFFQKHDTGGFGPQLRTIAIRESSGRLADYLHFGNAAGILACVQMGAIEFHGWASRCDRIEQPDRLVFDLDPGEGTGFAHIRQAAFTLRERLREMGLESHAMLTGGKGIHVIVPLTRGHGWDAHRRFARSLAEKLAAELPERFTATMSKARRRGKIFIDWLRNTRGATAIAPYSARARPGAPVAAPVAWAELETIARPDAFTIADAERLLVRARSGDLAAWGKAARRLPAA